MTEIWEPIRNYENIYEVSNLGRVKRLGYTRTIPVNTKTQFMTFEDKILKPILHKNGYLVVSLSKNNKRKIFSIHRLVAETFIDNPDNLPIVNHKDECKVNNVVSNLEWCDYSYNLRYGTRSEKAKQKLVKKVKCISTHITYNSIADAEKNTGIAHNSISAVCLGKRHTAGGYKWQYAEQGGGEYEKKP